MWVNAQHDGCPAEYRWRPLFNAAVWLTPTTRVLCSNAAKTRNPDYLGCPKLTKQSQPLVGQVHHIVGTCRRYCSLTSLFPILDTCLSCEDTARQSSVVVPGWRTFGDVLCPAFSASRVQHISDAF